MKVGTVTVHHAHNYGAMLQAYALQQTLLFLGYDTKIVDYDEIKSLIFQKMQSKSLRGVLSWIYYNFKTILKYNDYKISYNRFEKFYDELMVKTDYFENYEDICVADFDMLLVGSDQVWNLKGGNNRPYFQLDFSRNIIKASYAASMGSFFELSTPIRENFKKSLQEYSFFSVREKETGDYLTELLGDIDYQVNLDPIFLLSRKSWRDVASKAEQYTLPPKYILCYELIKADDMALCVEKLKKLTGLPVVVLAANVYSKQKGDFIFRDAGPLEMLNLTDKAEYVVTTSFHGSAFAILFHKPFYSLLTGHGSGRITELLAYMGLNNRIYYKNEKITISCDFTRADQYIAIQKNIAIKYLEGLKEVT